MGGETVVKQFETIPLTILYLSEPSICDSQLVLPKNAISEISENTVIRFRGEGIERYGGPARATRAW